MSNNQVFVPPNWDKSEINIIGKNPFRVFLAGTIDNGAGCTFNIIGADQDGAGSVLAWVTCKKLIATGTFTGSRPRVE